jgi:hypothetical protein
MAKKPDEQFSEKKAQQRFEAALRGALKAPHKPLKEKPKAKKAATAKPGAEGKENPAEAGLMGLGVCARQLILWC